jgi:hypothetical protein
MQITFEFRDADGVGTAVCSSLARDWRTALDRSLSRAARVLARNQRDSKLLAAVGAVGLAGSAVAWLH